MPRLLSLNCRRISHQFLLIIPKIAVNDHSDDEEKVSAEVEQSTDVTATAGTAEDDEADEEEEDDTTQQEEDDPTQEEEDETARAQNKRPQTTAFRIRKNTTKARVRSWMTTH